MRSKTSGIERLSLYQSILYLRFHCYLNIVAVPCRYNILLSLLYNNLLSAYSSRLFHGEVERQSAEIMFTHHVAIYNKLHSIMSNYTLYCFNYNIRQTKVSMNGWLAFCVS